MSDGFVRGKLMSRRAMFGAVAAPLFVSCQPDKNPVVSADQDRNTNVTVSYLLSVGVANTTSGFTGQSVIRVRYIDASREFMNYGPAARVEVFGEAVVIDLGPDRGLLFALLYGPVRRQDLYFNCDQSPLDAFPEAPTRTSRFGYNLDAARDLAASKGAHILRGNDLPFMVRFEDLSRPSTIVEVAPRELDRHFGKGFEYLGATLEVVDQEPTTGITSILPWAATHSQTLAGGLPAAEPLTSALSPSNFRRWSKV